MFLREEYTKFGDLIYCNESTKIFYNHERALITTLESGTSTHPQSLGTPVSSTSFGSTNHIYFTDRENLQVEVSHVPHPSIIEAMIKHLGIRNFKIYEYPRHHSTMMILPHNTISFDDPGDYAYFKLKYFNNFKKDAWGEHL